MRLLLPLLILITLSVNTAHSNPHKELSPTVDIVTIIYKCGVPYHVVSNNYFPTFTGFVFYDDRIKYKDLPNIEPNSSVSNNYLEDMC